MSERMQKREFYGAVAGVALLVFAMAWRWLFPWLERIDWSRPAVPVVEAVPERVRELAAQAESAPPDEVIEEEPVPPPGQLDEAQRKQVDEWLTAANAAVEERRWLSPDDDNALRWFGKVLDLDRGHAKARIGRSAVLDALFVQADHLLDEGDAKLAEDLVDALDQHGIDDRRASVIALRITRLADVRAQLAEAAQRIAAGAIFEPSDASAVAAFRQALVLDPRNRAAAKGLGDIENQVLDDALRAASEQRFADADALFVKAVSIGAESSNRADYEQKIGELKARASEDFLLRAEAALATRDLANAAILLEQSRALGAAPERIAAVEQRRANAALYANYQPGDRFSDAFKDRSGEGPQLVVVPVGEFLMGSPDSEPGRSAAEGPQHPVRITRPYALARNEITVAEFRRFVRESGYRSDAEQRGDSNAYDERTGRIVKRKDVSWDSDFQGGRAKTAEPVVHVSWNDAAAYAAWLSTATGQRYRLPSEAEFEFALRAGTTSIYWWGDGHPTRLVGNLTGDGDRSRSKRTWAKSFDHYRDGFWGPAPVARFEANGFGLFDLGSNVSEWVEDCWHQNFLRAPEDGSAWVNRGCVKRVVRGGSWGSEPDQARSAYRLGVAADTGSARVGFRVARDL
ncbi:MAG: SUMF1/EgtB/PvdO family nonheme iron enzyme [Rhodanobacteraceae bacterium]|nr:SUMF1/EgtB/PvdO family nonheme iron enzyme [Rhodanobacteraceae bacterium]MBL0041167.1 SUMF1/EgtB/PvdO family nonheme iron enzyme [Xanthomonadales bacterium]